MKIYNSILCFIFFVQVAFSQNDSIIYNTILLEVNNLSKTILICDSTVFRESTPNSRNIEVSITDSIKNKFIADSSLWLMLFKKLKLNSTTAIPINKNYFNNSVIISNKKFVYYTSTSQGWVSLYKEYSQSTGIKEFSKVVYSKNNDKAIVYFASYNFLNSAVGYLFFMKKNNNLWQVATSFPIWIE